MLAHVRPCAYPAELQAIGSRWTRPPEAQKVSARAAQTEALAKFGALKLTREEVDAVIGEVERLARIMAAEEYGPEEDSSDED